MRFEIIRGRDDEDTTPPWPGTERVLHPVTFVDGTSGKYVRWYLEVSTIEALVQLVREFGAGVGRQVVEIEIRTGGPTENLGDWPAIVLTDDWAER